ncbi:sulfotransferase [Vibrio paucivorans]|uniref:Sulfotransferase n=1 Tax=Vibrio paucivorans TaxID=2829489 RepID=A0A9X3HPG3_9VIBR|nr:sulfotransferase [Vibrio paucivorans]MCW8332815.1 sulfotransferase [Vibrio paucivorans]
MNELDIISELGLRLESVQESINSEIKNTTAKSLPNVYIVGCPRSGTTALLQYLSSTNYWCYPSNLITRFSKSVYIGSLVQQLIDNNETITFESTYGRSHGLLNTNEFFHFFRRFFPNDDIRHLSDEELQLVDTDKIAMEISSICKAFDKPFVSKALMMQANLAHFSRLMPNDIWLYISREQGDIERSIFKARLDEYGDASVWWSAKPSNYLDILHLEANEQISMQVEGVTRDIENGLAMVPESNKLEVSYENFIKKPEEVYLELQKKYIALSGRDIKFPSPPSNSGIKIKGK